MSEIRATTISNAAGTGPITMTGQYAAKAWVNFNGTGTVAIRDSMNVSSLSDTSTGEYEVNLTNAMSDTNFATLNAAATGSPLDSNTYNRAMESVGRAVNILDCITYAPNNTAIVDIPYIQISAHGDLA
jgi:hypothetical protein